MSVIGALNFRCKKTAAVAAGQPKAAVSTKFFLIFGVPLLRLRLQARLFCSVDACDVRLGKSSGNRIGTGS
jgi:hypothetical protein